jgi:hypothetical protein
MDAEKFDAVARRLVSGLTRREALRGLVAGAVAAAIGGTALEAAAAAKKDRCRKVTKTCSNQDRCCGKLTCGRSVLREGRFCCRKGEASCNDSKECCKPALCTDNLCQVP